MKWKLSDIVRRKDGSEGLYIIEEVGQEFVRFRCLRTNEETFKDKAIFTLRYCTLADYEALWKVA